jgi:hypothetical protein
MGMIILQMLPLCCLEMKIMQCADPVGLFCKFATPVTLIHIFAFGMRLVLKQHDSFTLSYSAIAGVAGMIIMVKVYRTSLWSVIKCQSVWTLIILSLVASVATTCLDLYLHPEMDIRLIVWEAFVRNIFRTANSYIELVAFVPAVLMVCREDKNASRAQTELEDTKRTATAFFLFLVCFYVTEGIYNAYLTYELSVMVMITSLAHLALLIDFAFYVLAHIYNPEKLMGDLRKWLPFDVSFEV